MYVVCCNVCMCRGCTCSAPQVLLGRGGCHHHRQSLVNCDHGGSILCHGAGTSSNRVALEQPRTITPPAAIPSATPVRDERALVLALAAPLHSFVLRPACSNRVRWRLVGILGIRVVCPPPPRPYLRSSASGSRPVGRAFRRQRDGHRQRQPLRRSARWGGSSGAARRTAPALGLSYGCGWRSRDRKNVES
jgi:hypothetical protein